MNPAMFIIIALVAIGIWFAFARHDVFKRTEDFIDKSINMGIHEENVVDVDFETKEDK